MSEADNKRAREEEADAVEARDLKRRIIAFVVPRGSNLPSPSDAELDAAPLQDFVHVVGVHEFLDDREAARKAKREAELTAQKAEQDAMRTAVTHELEKHCNTSITDVMFGHEVGSGKRPDGTVVVYAKFFVQFRAGALKNVTGETVVAGTVHHLAMRGTIDISLTNEGDRYYVIKELEGRSDLPHGEGIDAQLPILALISGILGIINVPGKAIAELTPRLICPWRESKPMPDGCRETDSILIFVNYTRMVEAQAQK